MSLQKNEWGKFCNCRNSKCMKLYCQCFAARVQCGKNCHCIDCHNRNNAEHLKIYKDFNNSDRKTFKQELARQHKGCACRKSGCTKKYCECYQAGLLCTDICKCIECQNNESLSNKKVISELKRSTSSASNKGASLYPIILTQDNRHLNQILADENPLNLKDEWIEQTAQNLYKKANKGSFSDVLGKMIDILSLLQSEPSYLQKESLLLQSDQNLFKDDHQIEEKQDGLKREEMQEQDSQAQQDSPQYESQSMMEEEDAQVSQSQKQMKDQDKN